MRLTCVENYRRHGNARTMLQSSAGNGKQASEVCVAGYESFMVESFYERRVDIFRATVLDLGS